MGRISFLGRTIKIAKKMLINGIIHSVTGVGMTLDGLMFIVKPVLVCSCVILIIQDANSIKSEINKGQAMKRKLSERFAKVIRPCVYVSLHVITLTLMSRAPKSRIDREGFPLNSAVTVGTLVQYSPTLARNFDRWLIKKAESNALKNHSFRVEQEIMASQRSLYYMMRVLRSCLIIQNHFLMKSFYLSRQNSSINQQKQVTLHQPQIYLETIKKPVGTEKKSEIQTSEFFEMLLEQSKIIDGGGVSELTKITKDFEISHITPEKFDMSKFSAKLTPNKGEPIPIKEEKEK
jgi:hypothetical protein